MSKHIFKKRICKFLLISLFLSILILGNKAVIPKAQAALRNFSVNMADGGGTSRRITLSATQRKVDVGKVITVTASSNFSTGNYSWSRVSGTAAQIYSGRTHAMVTIKGVRKGTAKFKCTKGGVSSQILTVVVGGGSSGTDSGPSDDGEEDEEPIVIPPPSLSVTGNKQVGVGQSLVIRMNNVPSDKKTSWVVVGNANNASVTGKETSTLHIRGLMPTASGKRITVTALAGGAKLGTVYVTVTKDAVDLGGDGEGSSAPAAFMTCNKNISLGLDDANKDLLGAKVYNSDYKVFHYVSSNPLVVQVNYNSGLLTAYSKGEATITIFLESDPTIKTTAHVKVGSDDSTTEEPDEPSEPEEPEEPQGTSLGTVYVRKGYSRKTALKSGKYTSSNKSIVTVSGTTITGVSVGSARVIRKSDNAYYTVVCEDITLKQATFTINENESISFSSIFDGLENTSDITVTPKFKNYFTVSGATITANVISEIDSKTGKPKTEATIPFSVKFAGSTISKLAFKITVKKIVEDEPEPEAPETIKLSANLYTYDGLKTYNVKSNVNSEIYKKIKSWSSTEQSVATIESGKITARAPGDSTFTGVDKDGNVLVSVAIHVYKIEYKEGSLDKKVGDQFSLSELISAEDGIASSFSMTTHTSFTDRNGNTATCTKESSSSNVEIVLGGKVVKKIPLKIGRRASFKGEIEINKDANISLDDLLNNSSEVSSIEKKDYQMVVGGNNVSSVTCGAKDFNITVNYRGATSTKKVALIRVKVILPPPEEEPTPDTNYQTYTLYKGIKGLKGKTLSGKGVTKWSSEDTSVAKVDTKGTVTAQGVGRTTVTGIDDNGNKIVEATINVNSLKDVTKVVGEDVSLSDVVNGNTSSENIVLKSKYFADGTTTCNHPGNGSIDVHIGSVVETVKLKVSYNAKFVPSVTKNVNDYISLNELITNWDNLGSDIYYYSMKTSTSLTDRDGDVALCKNAGKGTIDISCGGVKVKTISLTVKKATKPTEDEPAEPQQTAGEFPGFKSNITVKKNSEINIRDVIDGEVSDEMASKCYFYKINIKDVLKASGSTLKTFDKADTRTIQAVWRGNNAKVNVKVTIED